MYNDYVIDPYREYWDFNETHDYKQFKSTAGDSFSIVKYGNPVNKKQMRSDIITADRLSNTKKTIGEMAEYMSSHRSMWKNKKVQPGVELFIKLHSPTKYGKKVGYKVGEMHPLTPFFGLNKPKYVRHGGRSATPIGADGKLRATSRYIFLTVRRPKRRLSKFGISDYYETFPRQNFEFISAKQYNNLVIHELAHTCANHVMFRNDDHGPDFQMYENFLKKVKNKGKFSFF